MDKARMGSEVRHGAAVCLAVFMLLAALAGVEAAPYRTVSPLAFTSPNDVAGGGTGEVSVVGSLGGGIYPADGTVNIQITNLTGRALRDVIFVPQFVWQGTTPQMAQSYGVATPMGLYTDGGNTGMLWNLESQPGSVFRLFGSSGVIGVTGSGLSSGSDPDATHSDWDNVAGSFGFGPTPDQVLSGSVTYAAWQFGSLGPGEAKTIEIGVRSTGAFLGGNVGAWEGDVYEMIPEPGTIGLAIFGAAGLIVAARRRR